MLDPILYYSPEASLFPDLATRFARTGHLTGEELYLILDWKAPRARTRHLKRLSKNRTFTEAAKDLGAQLHGAHDDEQRLALLLSPEWGFALPTATAILTVLYPGAFTVYDIRVCDALNDFHDLGNKCWSRQTWEKYLAFLGAVRKEVPKGLNLRDADRWLWGKNKQDALQRELANA